MSWGATARAFPAMLRVGIAEAVAYRAEMFIWVLSTTMPFVSLALWSAVARSGPVGRYGQDEITLYFLSMFIVRQLTGSWAAWEMNFEVRSGRLSQRLLRPIHPLASYAAENLGAFPLRIVVSLPIVAIILWVVGTKGLPTDWRVWIIWLFSMLGGWLITLLANLAIGSLSLFMESSLKILDVWFTLFMVLSGYIVPVDLFPGWLRTAVEWLPFRYQLGYPVELLTNAHPFWEALKLLGVQYAWVGVGLLITRALWRRGQRHFEAYGG